MNRTRGAAVLGLMAGLALRPLLRRALMVPAWAGTWSASTTATIDRFLNAYAEDAVLHFNDGPHRWAGDHQRQAGDRGLPA